MTPTPYADLNAVLRELVGSIQQILGDSYVAACLQGSFAVGDFDLHSDVDFVVAVQRELSEAQVRALQSMHERIYGLDCAWAQHLEGSYFPKEVLQRLDTCGTPLWYLDHGSRSLTRSAHCNTLVVRWIVREHGVPLDGTNPGALVGPIPTELLRQEIREAMTGWWHQIRAEPGQINNRFYQAFAVLNYCRMLHDLHTGTIGSKRAGAEWAKTILDPSWAPLIDGAWSGRPDPAVSVRQPADPSDFERTIELVAHIVELTARVP